VEGFEVNYTGRFDQCLEKAIQQLGTSPSEWVYIRKRSGSKDYELNGSDSEDYGKPRLVWEVRSRDAANGLTEAHSTYLAGIKTEFGTPTAIRIRKSTGGWFYAGVVYEK
jgi:hypothetical protein